MMIISMCGVRSYSAAKLGCYVSRCIHRRFSQSNVASSNPLTIRGTIPQGGQGISAEQYAEVERIFSTEEIRLYGDLIGDNNPLHHGIDANELLKKSPEMKVLKQVGIIRLQEDGTTAKPLVHGMLSASVFSCIFGTLIPGSVYRSQTLKFQAPVFANEPVVGRVDVTAVRSWRDGVVVTCDTKVLKNETEVCIQGDAVVWLPGIQKHEI